MLLSQHKIELSNIRLEYDIQPNLPPVEGDFNQLQQCVINLIFNAIDAMPQGGDLALTSRLDGDSDKVIITVRDSGRGIPPEILPNIFEPFYTTKNEGHGVGLGLSTVYGIMERHHGSVNVESQPGEGTNISIELPASASNVNA
jgi:signal transduction histidine kinase